MSSRFVRRVAALTTCLLVLGLFQVVAETEEKIDWKRAQQLHQKFVRGEKLTEEEQAYHDRAARELRAKEKAEHPPAPPKSSVGLKPLGDMTADDRYKGQDGGLYGGGKNEPPEKHLQAALRQSKLIRPLDGDGKPSDNGKIVLVSIGMSNTTQEFSAFMRACQGRRRQSVQARHRRRSPGRHDGKYLGQPRRSQSLGSARPAP